MGALWREGRCGGRGHDSGRVQSSRGDETSGAPTSVSGGIILLTVTCNGFTITVVSDDWSVAEPMSHHFTYTKIPGATSAAICSGNQNAGNLCCRFFTEEVWDLSLVKLMAMLRHSVSASMAQSRWPALFAI